MTLLTFRRRRDAGRHSDLSVAVDSERPRRKGPVALQGRHAAPVEPLFRVVDNFTGWASLARVYDAAAKDPVTSAPTACPAQAPYDPDQTAPFFLEIPPMTRPRVCEDADMARLLADITPTDGAA